MKHLTLTIVAIVVWAILILFTFSYGKHVGKTEAFQHYDSVYSDITAKHMKFDDSMDNAYRDDIRSQLRIIDSLMLKSK